ncbi:putative succinate dehydrogenase (quinone) [Rosa chinensis]|uniref:Putative succinate dehydrogenase (Quinone) n=1 Tax=Rosa chinensis TaxID=74649 RepID=A0A2P6QZH9_ROSCH|nr:putative succinate dehydrogenase (quinone) [Rosa chinensis]
MARTVQAPAPSSTPVTSALVPPPPPPPITHLASSSYQPTDAAEPLQRAEFHNSLAILQEEFHQAIDAVNNNHTSFQNHITARLAALQSTMMQVLTGQHQPLSSASPSTPTSTPSFSPLPPPRTPAHIPPITFGSISTPITSYQGLNSPTPFPALTSPIPTRPESYPHTHQPLPSAPPQYSTISSIPQPQFTTTNNAYHTQAHHTLQYEPQFFRPPKVDLPRFTGDDAAGWITMVERYLRTQRIPQSEKVAIAASHFGPDACFWMNSFEQRHPLITWEQFVPAFLAHFGAGANHDFKIALSHLQQTSTVELFITAFTKLSCRAPDWNDDHLLPMFLGGLKPAIRNDVKTFNPLTLTEAQRLARCCEAKLSEFQSTSDLPPNPPYSTTSPLPYRANHTLSSPATTQPPNPPQVQLTKTPTHRNPRILSTSEQRERRAKGLCFNCDEQYTPTHSCKQPFLAILEAPTATPSDESSDTLDFPAFGA